MKAFENKSWLVLIFASCLSTAEAEQRDVYDGELPSDEMQAVYQDASKWTGTVVLKNLTLATQDEFHPEAYGNANSIVEFNGIASGYLSKDGTFEGAIKLTNQENKKAWVVGDGFSSSDANYIIAKLIGDGECEDKNSGGGVAKFQITINDGSAFTGNLTINNKRWVFGSSILPSADSGKIKVDDGQRIAFAGQTWSARGGVVFGSTVKAIGGIGDFILMPKPSSIPNILGAEGEEAACALEYSDGALRIVKAVARDKFNQNYGTIEAAIRAFGGAQVTLLTDAVIEVGKLDVGGLFTVDLAGHSLAWIDSADKFIAINTSGKFRVMKGQPDNGLSSFYNYILGLKSRAGEGETPDYPFLKMTASEFANGRVKASFSFFHTANGMQIHPQETTNKRIKYQVAYASSPNAMNWIPVGEPTVENVVNVDLPQPEPGKSAVRYFKPLFIMAD